MSADTVSVAPVTLRGLRPTSLNGFCRTARSFTSSLPIAPPAPSIVIIQRLSLFRTANRRSGIPIRERFRKSQFYRENQTIFMRIPKVEIGLLSNLCEAYECSAPRQNLISEDSATQRVLGDERTQSREKLLRLALDGGQWR